MSKRMGLYPRVRVEGGGRGTVSQAGLVLLVETVRKAGLDSAISAALAPWHKPRAVHDPGKVLLDVALATALGGDCLADVAMLRAEPEVFGPVASDPTLSRLIDALAVAGPKALTAIRGASRSAHPGLGVGRYERPGAWVAEITDMPDLSTWPKGMRLIVRKERPHPGAQLRFTDLNGLRLTCFATNTQGGQLADLELRHRRRARCEDRIRNARDTGLRNLPLHDTAQNQIWLEIISIALDLLAWMPMLALTGETRRWEPKRLRLRLFSAAARLVNTGRRRWLRFTARWPWTSVITRAIDRLHTLPNSG
ncbi:transposase [Streptomyces sp. ISL-98]|uniref:transposase n=1 Tax=Streptomyces sp. ISL-98 TaxID=2819192 RepID=UPI001BEA48F1|nr:transposase [Streptomyces sp. ISL-98]MBT2505969.1 transposase [Streptomyces sp. ISL-98]